MLMNNLDPDVAEDPDHLVVYGGTGRAARSWEAFDAICSTLRGLEGDETLLVQSGKPVGVFRTNEWAPRVLLANSNLVPEWANWTEFRRLESLGLTMYGQMTAGSWIYIGTQGILQGTYECFAEIARRKFGGSLSGTITVTAGLGGMGGAQPLAITMNGGVALCVDVDPDRIARRIEHRYLDEVADSLDDAVARCLTARDTRKALSVGVAGNAAIVLPALVDADFPADIVTDQTSAHDPLSYVPADLTMEATTELARSEPDELVRRARLSMAAHCAAMVAYADKGAEVFDYGNSLRTEAALGGFERAFDYPGFLPAYIRPLFCEGKGPFRWVALSGDPARYRRDRSRRARRVPRRRGAAPLDRPRRRTGGVPGLAGTDLLARLRRASPPRAALQRDGAKRSGLRADRDRARSSRLRVGCVAVSGDRGDG